MRFNSYKLLKHITEMATHVKFLVIKWWNK